MGFKTILLFVMVILCLGFVGAATLHGSVYDSSYNLMNDVQLYINTSPKQTHISKNGLYFFNAPLGTHEIIAEKYYQKKLVFSARSIIDVTKDGEFNIDIIMELVPGVEIPSENKELGPSLLTLLMAKYAYLFYGGVAFLVLVSVIALFFLGRYLLRKFGKKKVLHDTGDVSYTIKTSVGEDVSSEGKEAGGSMASQSADLDTVLNIIKEEGGRATQKDIRRKIPLSEAKVSLMISELEAKGKIQKLKKGRGNILVLK